jgi:hypothetical protein
MSIDGKHAYRFGFLKSEKWQAVRLEALSREKAKCQICNEESIFNDAHHVWYPENIYDTEEQHLVILCRPCHEFIHDFLPECKTSDAESGIANWIKFSRAMIAWRVKKAYTFKSINIDLDFLFHPNTPKQLRAYFKKVLTDLKSTDRKLNESNSCDKDLENVGINEVCGMITKWYNESQKHAPRVDFPIADSDYQI